MALSGRAVLKGARDALPILIGVIPFGLITGATAISIGVSATQVTVMSMLTYAGASQVAAFGLIDLGAPLLIVLATVGMVNLRLAIYGAAFAPYMRRIGLPMRAVMSAFLTDQVFAFSVLRFDEDPQLPRPPYFLGFTLTMWFAWVVATAAGALLGARVPESWSLDFAIPLIFLALLVPVLRDRPNVAAAFVGGGVALTASGLPFNLGLVLGILSGVAAGALTDRLRDR
jgi:4-azaleucine resistance transporter AzlC